MIKANRIIVMFDNGHNLARAGIPTRSNPYLKLGEKTFLKPITKGNIMDVAKSFHVGSRRFTVETMNHDPLMPEDFPIDKTIFLKIPTRE
jgi:hypothetical protein